MEIFASFKLTRQVSRAFLAQRDAEIKWTEMIGFAALNSADYKGKTKQKNVETVKLTDLAAHFLFVRTHPLKPITNLMSVSHIIHCVCKIKYGTYSSLKRITAQRSPRQ